MSKVFQESLIAMFAGSYIDVASVHLHTRASASSLDLDYSQIDHIRQAMRAVSFTATIWITETGTNAHDIDTLLHPASSVASGNVSATAYLLQGLTYVSELNKLSAMASTDGISRVYFFSYTRGLGVHQVPFEPLVDGFFLTDAQLQATVAAQDIFAWVALSRVGVPVAPPITAGFVRLSGRRDQEILHVLDC